MMCFSSCTFFAGDSAFFAVILGKENMSGSWCNWCKLSPKGVENGNLAETLANLKGCAMRPLIDAVAVENFILSILHILIGMGAVLIESFLEWIEERVEKLTLAEVEAQNRELFKRLFSLNKQRRSWRGFWRMMGFYYQTSNWINRC